MTDLEYFDNSKVELVNWAASDSMVARAAWVSTVGDESKDKDISKIGGLINYLMRDKHGSPFEHNMFTFFIKTPLFVRSEFHRHRVGWSYNEESGRYSQMKPHFFVIPDNRNMVQTGKPGHYIFSPGTPELVAEIQQEMREDSEYVYNRYLSRLERGVAKEVARETLGLNLMTSFWATCNARSLMHFLSLRTKNDSATFPSNPQWEINQVASQMELLFEEAMPLTHAAWNANGRVAP
jgi:thymidylate synthase (FAD)